MRRPLVLLGISLLIYPLSEPRATAQTTQPAAATAGPVSIAIDGGLAAASAGSGAAIGGRLVFDVTDRVAVETTGAYLDRGPGSDALSLSGALLVKLVTPDRATVPYLAVGGGLYRASFDLGHRRLFGGLSDQFPAGMQMIPIAGAHGFGMIQGPYSGPSTWTGPWAGSTYMPNQMPGFYVERLGRMVVPADGRWGMKSFTDPALSFGGGVRFDVTPHLFVRPDARALVVVANGDTYTVGVLSLGLGYRF